MLCNTIAITLTDRISEEQLTITRNNKKGFPLRSKDYKFIVAAAFII